MHRIQYRRDRTNIVLTQQQNQQPFKNFRLTSGISQHVVHLLQSTKQDLPKLIENLRAAVVTIGIHLICQIREALRITDSVQKRKERIDLFRQPHSFFEFIFQCKNRL